MKLNEICTDISAVSEADNINERMGAMTAEQRKRVKFTSLAEWKKTAKKSGNVYKAFDSKDLKAEAANGRTIGRWDHSKGEGFIQNMYVHGSKE